MIRRPYSVQRNRNVILPSVTDKEVYDWYFDVLTSDLAWIECKYYMSLYLVWDTTEDVNEDNGLLDSVISSQSTSNDKTGHQGHR